MKTFQCAACGQPVFFENVQCTRCKARLGFIAERLQVATLQPTAANEFLATFPGGEQVSVKSCKNGVDYAACSWMLPKSDSETYCIACRLNVTIPDLTDPNAKQAWLKLEQAKRRLIYGLLRFGLPIEVRSETNERGLGFSFLADRPDAVVFTGQSDGLITINIAEADAPFREKIRHQLSEQYRTLLGHFRHEIGHYYWDRLVNDQPEIEGYRAEFGDERADYQAALEHHYKTGPIANWSDNFVSAYASAHPWEDWAETWAHYLHITDTLETAQNFKLVVSEPSQTADPIATADLDTSDFDRVIAAWVPVTIAVNSLNRSMGLSDMYPFVLTEAVIRKLRFVHDLVQRASAQPIAESGAAQEDVLAATG